MREILDKLLTKFNKLNIEIETIKKYNTCKEDWFLVYIMVELQKLENSKIISDLCIEKLVDTKGIDLFYRRNELDYYVEFKHFNKNCKNEMNYPLSSWLSKKSIYIQPD